MPCARAHIHSKVSSAAELRLSLSLLRGRRDVRARRSPLYARRATLTPSPQRHWHIRVPLFAPKIPCRKGFSEPTRVFGAKEGTRMRLHNPLGFRNSREQKPGEHRAGFPRTGGLYATGGYNGPNIRIPGPDECVPARHSAQDVEPAQPMCSAQAMCSPARTSRSEDTLVNAHAFS